MLENGGRIYKRLVWDCDGMLWRFKDLFCQWDTKQANEKMHIGIYFNMRKLIYFLCSNIIIVLRINNFSNCSLEVLRQNYTQLLYDNTF